MTDYIISLNDISEGVRILANSCRIISVFPFISGVAVRADDDVVFDNGYVKSVVRTAQVTVCLDRVRNLVRFNRPRGDGAGVGVAIIDTGVSPHLDFTLPWRIDAFVDLVGNDTETYDDNGHGTAVAGVLAGSGLLSNGKFVGIAPKARIISIKALNAKGEGTSNEILQAMQWIWTYKEKYNIKVVCMSFGADPLPKNDPLVAGVEALHNRGITVVVSGGNGGPGNQTIKSPGVSPFAITVGGAEIVDGKLNVAEYSSRGPVGRYVKPDLVAPSTDVVCADISEDYAPMSGTSIATPIVAGACALILAEHPNYTPDKVKELLIQNTQKIDCNIESCGNGFLDMSFI